MEPTSSQSPPHVTQSLIQPPRPHLPNQQHLDSGGLSPDSCHLLKFHSIYR